MIPAAVAFIIGGYGWGWTVGNGKPIIYSEVCAVFFLDWCLLGLLWQ